MKVVMVPVVPVTIKGPCVVDCVVRSSQGKESFSCVVSSGEVLEIKESCHVKK